MCRKPFKTGFPARKPLSRIHSARDRQYPYYRISVRNYTIFYVVIDDVLEVRRIVYSRRDLRKQI